MARLTEGYGKGVLSTGLKALLAGIGMLGLSAAPLAEEVAVGTIISKDNIDQLSDMTLEGHRIGDMLTEGQETMIRNFNFKMKLRHHAKVAIDPRMVALTKEYAGQAKLDAKDQVVNYTTGMPFPVIEQSDPKAAVKLMYNILRPGWLGYTLDLNPMYFLNIDGKKGLQREMGWRFKRMILSGRQIEPYVLDDVITKYESLINLYPNDTRGLGILSVNYSDGRLADIYAYIKSVRRVRRLSSGAWADPVSATDILTDETFGLNLNPAWYKSWEIIEKKWVLGGGHATSRPIVPSARKAQDRFPDMNFDEAPYWNYTETYEPREVWVVKATPPDRHLVGHRMMYVDTDPYAPMMHWQDLYDKKGDLWRAVNVAYTPAKWVDGTDGMAAAIVGFWDLQRVHATVLYNGGPLWKFADPSAKPAEYAPEALPRQLQ